MSELTVRTALNNGMMAINQTHYMKLPNSKFFIKKDGAFTTETPSGEPWLRLTLLSLGDEPRSLGAGGNNYRSGLAQIDIFTPKAQPAGDLIAAQLVDEVRKIFKTGAAFGGIKINSASSSNGTDEQDWYSRIINVDFYIYETR